MSTQILDPNFSGKVRGLSTEGYGVVEHPDGRVFFVPGSWPGDEANFEIQSIERRYGYAKLINLLRPSDDRVVPPCPHQGSSAGSCGGCPWMIGTYASQLLHKEQRLQHALSRAKLLGDESVLRKIWGSEKTFGYRNRAQFKTDGITLGFVGDASHSIVPIEACMVLNEGMGKLWSTLKGSLPNEAWRPGPGHHWNFIDVDDENSPTDVSLNRRRPFRQGNSAQNERMKYWLRERLESLDMRAPVLELFSGSGNFTEVFVAGGFKRIVTTEVSETAIQSLVARSWPGVQCVRMDLGERSYRQLVEQFSDTEVLFLDPPREGAKGIERLVAQLPKLKTIFYFSCDVATFVRDAVKLETLKFRARELQPLDLFPHTAHVELMSFFSRAAL